LQHKELLAFAPASPIRAVTVLNFDARFKKIAIVVLDEGDFFVRVFREVIQVDIFQKGGCVAQARFCLFFPIMEDRFGTAQW
jgi:hypothetical protein